MSLSFLQHRLHLTENLHDYDTAQMIVSPNKYLWRVKSAKEDFGLGFRSLRGLRELNLFTLLG